MTPDPWELLREARQYVGFCPTTQEGMDVIGAVRDRIDAALAQREPKGTTIKWIRIPAGSITTQDGRVLTVEKDFELAATPTTQHQYESVMGSNPSHFKGAQRPVECVSAHDADAFASKIGARLPTEIEWEYALLAGNTADPYDLIEEIAWCHENSGGETHDVGQKLPNAWSLYDMLGNVWEWTSSEQEQMRVNRGGSWGDSASWLRGANRIWNGPGYQSVIRGFRCGRDIGGTK